MQATYNTVLGIGTEQNLDAVGERVPPLDSGSRVSSFTAKQRRSGPHNPEQVGTTLNGGRKKEKPQNTAII